MSAAYDDATRWHRIDSALKDAALINILHNIECAICLEVMLVPFMCACGHSFCYRCLNSWFENKLNCPTCRTELKEPPTLNIHLRDISKTLTDVFLDSLENPTAGNILRDARTQQVEEYEKAVKSKRALFGKSFQLVPMIVDTSDGVPRCGNCHWEAHGSVCLHCGEPIRNPSEDGYFDSDDGEAYNEDQEEVELYGIAGDAYDSEDSFLDDRDITEINTNLSASSNLDSEDDDNLGTYGSWDGFRSDSEMYRNSGGQLTTTSLDDSNEPLDSGRRRHHVARMINVPNGSEDEEAYTDDDLLEELLNGDLQSAVERLHESHLHQVDEELSDFYVASDDDLDVLYSGRRRISQYLDED